MINYYSISATVENNLRVLQRITCILSRHCLNIETLNVNSIVKTPYSRIVLTVYAEEKTLEIVRKKLRGLVELFEISVNKVSVEEHHEHYAIC